MIALLLALAAASPAETDILAQVKAGKVLCSNPDPASKTCSTIDRLALRTDGALLDSGETLLVPNQAVTLETTSIVRIKSGAMCGVIDMADFQKGIVRANGTAVPPERNAAVLAKLSKVFEPLAGQETCEGLRVENGHLTKVAQVERMDLPLPGKAASWIGPDEGYRVAPRPAPSP